MHTVIGGDVGYSLSPKIHNYLATYFNVCEGVFYKYTSLPKLAFDFKTFGPTLSNIAKLREELLLCEGANITAPFKELAFLSADETHGVTQTLRASNTIIRNGKTLSAYNTDVYGFLKTLGVDGMTFISDSKIIRNVKTNKKALLLGGGGASKSIAFSLCVLGYEIFLHSRGTTFVLEDIKIHNIDAKGILDTQFDIVINATSSSLHNQLPLDENVLKTAVKKAFIAYDLMYNKDIFLSFCKNANKKLEIIDGKNMLIHQAILAFSIFTNIPLDMLNTQVENIRQAISG